MAIAVWIPSFLLNLNPRSVNNPSRSSACSELSSRKSAARRVEYSSSLSMQALDSALLARSQSRHGRSSRLLAIHLQNFSTHITRDLATLPVGGWRLSTAQFFRARWCMFKINPRNRSPNGVSLYSTCRRFDSKTLRWMAPSSSSSRNRAVRTFWLMPGGTADLGTAEQLPALILN